MRKLITFIVIMLSFTMTVNSQEHSSNKYINSMSTSYSKKLNLTKSQSKKFKQILKKYNKQLEGVEDKRLFNRIVKMQTLEISKLITNKQYEKYKVVVLELELYKKYKL